MDKDQKKTLVFVATGSAIGGILSAVFQGGQPLSMTLIVRVVLFALIVVAIAVYVFKKIK